MKSGEVEKKGKELVLKIEKIFGKKWIGKKDIERWGGKELRIEKVDEGENECKSVNGINKIDDDGLRKRDKSKVDEEW